MATKIDVIIEVTSTDFRSETLFLRQQSHPQIPSRNNHVGGSNTVYHICPHQFAILQSLGFEYLHFLSAQSLSQTIGHPPPTPGCNFLGLVLEITLLGM